MLIFLDKHFGTMTVDNTIYSLVHFQTNPALSDTLTNIHYIPSVWQPCWTSATGLEQTTTTASPTPSFHSYIISHPNTIVSVILFHNGLTVTLKYFALLITVIVFQVFHFQVEVCKPTSKQDSIHILPLQLIHQHFILGSAKC